MDIVSRAEFLAFARTAALFRVAYALTAHQQSAEDLLQVGLETSRAAVAVDLRHALRDALSSTDHVANVTTGAVTDVIIPRQRRGDPARADAVIRVLARLAEQLVGGRAEDLGVDVDVRLGGRR